MKPVLTLLLGLVAMLLAAPVSAQTFPTDTVTIYVGYPPGGTSDTTARILGGVMEKDLGVPVVVVNKPGATQTVAAATVAEAKPDGYTLMVFAEVDFTSKVLEEGEDNLPFSVDDFVPICATSPTPYLVLTRKDAPWNNLDEFIAAAKEKPGEITAGNTGIGGGAHRVMQAFAAATETELNHVPFRGGGPTVTALVGGHIDVAGSSWGLWAGPVRSGQVKPLVVLGDKIPELENIPTFEELGYPKFFTNSWLRLAAPAKTPKSVLDRLVKACERLETDDEAQAALKSSGLNPVYIGPDEVSERMKADHDGLAQIIKAFAGEK